VDVLKPLALAAVLLAAPPALAHVAADPGEAPAGGYQAVRFRVGHGCSETATTTALRIEIPPGVPSVRAQPKAGWSLAFERRDGQVVAVTWAGALPPDQFDEFALFFRLPDAPGVLSFPAIQTCGGETARWTGRDARHPAPTLRLVAPPEASPQGGHQHH
jgi:uncharacterized protein YcnI